MEMDHILRLLPDMYMMNAFMSMLFPGDVARPMALACCLAAMACSCCFNLILVDIEELSIGLLLLLVDDEVLLEERICFSKAKTRFRPSGAGIFCRVVYPASFSESVRSIDDHLLLSVY